MIERVFLDLDDTIFDFHKAERIAVSATLEEMGVPPREDILTRYSEINDWHWKALERGEMTRREVLTHRFRQLFDEIGRPDVSEERTQQIYEYRLGCGHYYMEGAEQLLRDLHGVYSLYIVSNGTRIVQERRIASAGIAPLFDGIFISQDIGYDKPRREFFEAVFARIPGFRRESAVIVGDSLTSDILGGIHAGIRTVWFDPRGKAPVPGIRPDHTVRALSELPALLRTL